MKLEFAPNSFPVGVCVLFNPKACIISDNATRFFLETIIKFTEKYIEEKGGLYGDKNN